MQIQRGANTRANVPSQQCAMIQGLRSDPAAPENGQNFNVTRRVLLGFCRYC